jgi:hypothetical protein
VSVGTTDQASSKTTGKASLKARRRRQKAWRERRRQRYAEALAMLAALEDDEPITIIGKDAPHH